MADRRPLCVTYCSILPELKLRLVHISCFICTLHQFGYMKFYDFVGITIRQGVKSDFSGSAILESLKRSCEVIHAWGLETNA